VDITERRCTERRPAGDNRVRILWDGGPGTLETQARLVNISRGGASFVAKLPPPPGQEVCFRLETAGKTGWVLARVVRSDGGMEGGLSFSRYFPHDLFAGLI
jgi:hypothetical protein